ncbi:hypothetical protein [Massilia aurea]|uniref:hypothetical protein n=1 Tax=Massilia aurea TaxID=373040 RepID=UPI001E2BCF4A|nr:hypothetical protein [Massilia aurea]
MHGIDVAADGEVHVSLETSDFIIMLPYSDTGRGRLIGIVHASRTAGAGPYTFDNVGHSALSSLGLRVDQVHWFSTYRVHHRVTAITAAARSSWSATPPTCTARPVARA